MTLVTLSSCANSKKQPRAANENMIELSIHDEVSITRHHNADPQITLPVHALRICQGKSLLAVLQRFYPDYWFSELSTLPSGAFDITITPHDGLILTPREQSILLIQAYEQSFGLKIELDDINRIATIR